MAWADFAKGFKDLTGTIKATAADVAERGGKALDRIELDDKGFRYHRKHTVGEEFYDRKAKEAEMKKEAKRLAQEAYNKAIKEALGEKE